MVPRGLQAGIKNSLWLQGDLRPMRIWFSAENQSRKISEQLSLLRSRMAICVFRHRYPSRMTLHMKLAKIGFKVRLLDIKSNFGSMIGKDKVVEIDMPFRSTQVQPLLMLSLETAVKGSGDSSGELHFGREADRY